MKMKRRKTGTYVPVSTVGEAVRAFVPAPLPPQPPLELSDALQEACNRAYLTLGRLDSTSAFLPDASLFLYQYVRKEAVLSSQIEGTQSSLSDLMLFEIDGVPGAPLDDVREVSHCVSALEHGIQRFKEGFPLCLRLIKELHGVLLQKGRGSDRMPGEFRHSQNWIGGTRPGNAIYVPPPPDHIASCMGELERFLHDQGQSNPLIKAALAHALLARPVSTVSALTSQTGLVPNTVNASLNALSGLGIVQETTGKKRDRVYLYGRCMQIMSQEIPDGDSKP